MAVYHMFLTIYSQRWTIYIHMILHKKHLKNIYFPEKDWQLDKNLLLI